MLESYLWMHGKWWHYEALCLAPLGILGSVILFFESPLIIGKIFSVGVGVFCFYVARYALRKAGIIKTPAPQETPQTSSSKSPTIREYLRMKQVIVETLDYLDEALLDDTPRRCQLRSKNNKVAVQVRRISVYHNTGYICESFHTYFSEKSKDPTYIRRVYLIIAKNKLPVQIRRNEAVLPNGNSESPIWLDNPEDWSTPQYTTTDIQSTAVASREDLTDLYNALTTMTAEVVQ